jgi:general secretion pathway protein G
MSEPIKIRKNEPPKYPIKVRCAYCKSVFMVEAKGKKCPSCGRPVVMPGQLSESPSEKRRKFLRRRMLAKSGAGSTMAMAFHDVFSARRFSKIILVIGGVAIVGALVFDTPAPVPYVPPSEIEKAGHELTVLRVALERFERDCGRYPTTEEGLKALVQKPDGVEEWGGFYVTLVTPDPWHHPYVYRCVDGRFALLSLGPDGVENTKDDIPVPRISSEQLAPYLEKNEDGWVTPSARGPSAKDKEKTF